MSYLDDLTYRTLKDGYDTSLPVRKTLKFLGATLLDDERNDQTIISMSDQLINITLYDVLVNSNDAQNQKIINLGTPEYSADAATKGYVDSSVSSIGLDDVLAVSNIATSDIDMSDYKITSLAIPTDGYDAANKYYVDTQIENIPAPVLDHGGLTGLSDDDHTQYLLVNGSRAMSNDLNMGNFLIHNVGAPVAGTDAVNLNYVSSVINYLDVYYYVAINKQTLTSGVNTTIYSYTFAYLTSSTDYFAKVAFRSTIWQDGYEGQVDGSVGVHISVSSGGDVTCTFNSLYPDVSELPAELSSANYTLVPITDGFALKCQQDTGSNCYAKSNIWIISLDSLV